MHEVTYQVNVLDRDGQIALILDSTVFANLTYSRVLNDVGACQITFAITPEGTSTLTRLMQINSSFIGLRTIKDRLLQVMRFVDGTGTDEGVYIVRYVRLFDEDGQRWCILAGFSPEYFLLQRLIDVRNDPLVAGGYSTKSGPADTVMAEYVEEQAGSGAAAKQQVSGLTVAEPAGVGQTVGARQQWEGLLETLQGLTAQGQMDFRVDYTGDATFEFVAERIGNNLTMADNYGHGKPFVLFSPARDNMVNPDLELDWRDEKTDVALLGQGSGDERELYGAMSGAVSETPYSYAMIAEDARDNEDGDATEYLTQAREALSGNRGTKAFSFEVVNPAEQYRVLWNLGDRVTVEWADYITEDMRITAIEISVDEEEIVTPTLESLAYTEEAVA